MAKKYFGDNNPLGKHYRYREGGKLSNLVEIVGVVKDSKYGALREDIPPTTYAAWSQGGNLQLMTYLQLRASSGAPTALIAGVKQVIGEANPNVSLEFTTLATKVSESLSRERLLATLSGFFGILAMALAMIGLYGVMSYNVARRRNEIGIRMALGAEQPRVLRLVLGEVVLLIGVGIVVGLSMAMAMTRFVTRFLYGVAPNDPLTLFLSVSVLAGVAFVAGYLPARRASRQNPMIALREE
jgi:ABC-type antimicrobial peptide transport system permease subunit